MQMFIVAESLSVGRLEKQPAASCRAEGELDPARETVHHGCLMLGIIADMMAGCKPVRPCGTGKRVISTSLSRFAGSVPTV
jgi:hypothetical protein